MSPQPHLSRSPAFWALAVVFVAGLSWATYGAGASAVTAAVVALGAGAIVVAQLMSSLRESERRYREILESQLRLARVGRLTTLAELAAAIAHQIRQPLAAVVLNGATTARWLNRDEPNLDEARRALARMVQDAERAEEVVRELRRLTQKSEPRLSTLDLGEAIQEALTVAEREPLRQGVSVRTELDQSERSVLADRVQLQQVLLMLITNGLESMSAAADGPRVLTIRTESGGRGEVTVSVEDTGLGLDPAAVDRVFEPFFTTKPGGLGLDLAISRSIIDAHGGCIWAEPIPPHGAAFRFTLPRAAAK